MNKLKKLNKLILLFIPFFLWSCGYRFAGGGLLPGAPQSVGVAIFENRSAETGIEQIFTNDMIYELNHNGVSVKSPQDADAVIYGVVESINTDTISRKGLITSLERRISVQVRIKLINRDGGVLWAEKAISGEESYGVLSEKAATDYGKRQAIETLSARIAEEVYSRMSFEGEFPDRGAVR